MEDEPRPLSPEEKTDIYNKTGMSCVVALCFFLAYFCYRMFTNPFDSASEAFVGWGFPFFVGIGLVSSFSLEFFYHRALRKSFLFHAKHFGMNMLLLALLTMSFLAVWIGLVPVLSSYAGERISISVSVFLWALVIAIASCTRPFRKYWKGP